jgi:hypothetical protein
VESAFRALRPFGRRKRQVLDVRRHVEEDARSIRGHERIGGQQVGKSGFEGRCPVPETSAVDVNSTEASQSQSPDHLRQRPRGHGFLPLIA